MSSSYETDQQPPPQHDSLYSCVQYANTRGESVFTGVLAHCWRNLHPDCDGLDRWHLTLVLATVLAYLYIRRAAYVAIGFLVVYVLTYAFYYCVKRWTCGTSASIAYTHTQDRELLTDPLLFTATLFTAWYIIDYSAIGFGIGQSIHTVTHHPPSSRERRALLPTRTRRGDLKGRCRMAEPMKSSCWWQPSRRCW